MRFRKILHAFAGFLLPGLAAGWLLSSCALQFSDDPVLCGVFFSSFALAGAITGRWLFRNDQSLAIGLLCLMALPVFNFRWLFPGIAFAFAVFAVRPIRTVNRQLFQAGVLAAVITALAAGGQYLGAALPAKICFALLLPAAAMLTNGRKGKRKVTAAFAVLACMSVLCLPWKQPAAAPYILPWGESAAIIKTEKNTTIRIGSRIYHLPEALERNQPDLLTAALQPVAENIQVLVIGEVPGNAASYLEQLPWVAGVESIVCLPNIPDLDKMQKKVYELIFIQELPGSTLAAKNMFFSRIMRSMMAFDTVLAAPAEYTANLPGCRSALLPGSGGRIRLWAEDITPLADTFSKLEARLEKRNPAQTEISFTGLMQTLYELRPAEPGPVQRNATPLEKALAKLRKFLQKSRLILPAAILFLLGICWFSRSPRYGENFAVFVHGTACMFCLMTILQAAGKYQLLLPTIPLMIFFGLMATALPHRSERAGKWRIPAIICAAIAGGILLPDFTGKFLTQAHTPAWAAGTILLPALLLLAPALRFGCIHKGGESARYLHFAGLLAGALLSLAAPEWAALPAALLLFAA